VQVNLNARAPKVTHPRVTSSHYLLSGLIRCRKCGAAYIGYAAKSGRFHYYVCGTTYSKGKETCPSQHLPKEAIERFVVDKVKGYILTDGHLAEMVKFINEELGSSIKEYKERIEAIDSEIEQWQIRLERLYDFVETKAIEPVRMAQRITQVQDKIDEMQKVRLGIEEALQTRRLEPLDPKVVLDYVKDLKQFLEESNIFERRAVLQSFVESVEVDDDQITLNYTVPLPPDNSKQEVVSVLDIVPSSPVWVILLPIWHHHYQSLASGFQTPRLLDNFHS